MSTKSRGVIAFLVLWATTAAHSQSRFAISPLVGFTRGSLFSTFSSGKVGSLERGNGAVVGLMAQYQLRSKWSMTGGLAYNWIHYDMIYQQKGLKRVGEVMLPLLLNYRASSKRLSPYVSVGVIVEKRLVEKYPTFSMADFSRLGAYPPNLSVGGGVGISYRISPKCSFIVQPTMFYRIKSDYQRKLYTKYNSLKMNVQAQVIFYL